MPEMMPVVGWAPEVEGFGRHRFQRPRVSTATGFGGYGIAMGPIIGHLMIEAIVEGKPSLDIGGARFLARQGRQGGRRRQGGLAAFLSRFHDRQGRGTVVGNANSCSGGAWRRLPPFVLLTALLVLAPLAAEAAKVTYLVKPAQVKREDSTRWLSLNMGDTVREGDSVRTGIGARVELSITKKRQFRIGQATEIVLEGLDEKKPSEGLRASVRLLLGRFWGSIRTPLQGTFNERVRISTPTATIGIKGTTFGVDYDKKDKTTQVAVVTGQVAVVPPGKEFAPPTQIAGPREIAPPQEVSREEWTRLVAADQKLIIRPGEPPHTEPLTAEDKKDAWLAFNIARDQQ